MAPTKDRARLWLITHNSGIFSFSNARYYGSMGGTG